MNQNEIYNQLVEECKAIIGESGYEQNVTTLKARWELGLAIVQVNDEMDRQKIYGLEIILNLSKDLKKSGQSFSPRILRYCVQFYKSYKEKTFGNVLPNLPEGKNTTWRDMCQIHLKSTADEGSEPQEKSQQLPQTIFNIHEIEDAFKNFALDVLGISDPEQIEDRWEEFEEYFK